MFNKHFLRATEKGKWWCCCWGESEYWIHSPSLTESWNRREKLRPRMEMGGQGRGRKGLAGSSSDLGLEEEGPCPPHARAESEHRKDRGWKEQGGKLVSPSLTLSLRCCSPLPLTSSQPPGSDLSSFEIPQQLVPSCWLHSSRKLCAAMCTTQVAQTVLPWAWLSTS